MIRRLDEIPLVADGGAADPDWHPVTHYFGLTAFGLNVFVAREPGQELVAEHDETGSGQEEVYLVTAGSARFRLDDAEHVVAAGAVVALTDPAVRRQATALERGTTLVAVGAPARESFPTSWNPAHFVDVPRAEASR